jgi:hypothetical protein
VVGGRRQKAGVRRQEIGDRRRKTEDRRREGGDRRRELNGDYITLNDQISAFGLMIRRARVRITCQTEATLIELVHENGDGQEGRR